MVKPSTHHHHLMNGPNDLMNGRRPTTGQVVNELRQTNFHHRHKSRNLPEKSAMMKNRIALLLNFFLMVPMLRAQPASMQAVIDEYLSTLPDLAEIAIGIIRPDTVIRLGYRIEDGVATPVDNAGRIFEIGSVTKTFTGALLIDEVQRGKMNLDDPIAAHLPKRDKIDSKKAKEITLKQLVTHTSGLSNGPASFVAPVLRAKIFSANNPNRYISWKQYRNYLRNEKLDATPGEKWAYNNCGMALLGQLIAEKEHRSWEELVQERLFIPLGMTHSYSTGEGVPSDLLVPGYDGKSRPAGLWDMNFINPAGSIKSCADDMLKWIAAHLNAPTGSLFCELKKGYDIPTGWDGNYMGNAWIHRQTEAGQIIWHDGATGAYRAFVAFNDDLKTGVVILTNFSAHHPAMQDAEGKSMIRKYGFRILDSIF